MKERIKRVAVGSLFSCGIRMLQIDSCPCHGIFAEPSGGFVYHVLDRAIGRATLFDKSADAWQPMRVLAYGAMPNHGRLILWPHADGDLSAFMRWLTVTCKGGDNDRLFRRNQAMRFRRRAREGIQMFGRCHHPTPGKTSRPWHGGFRSPLAYARRVDCPVQKASSW